MHCGAYNHSISIRSFNADTYKIILTVIRPIPLAVMCETWESVSSFSSDDLVTNRIFPALPITQLALPFIFEEKNCHVLVIEHYAMTFR